MASYVSDTWMGPKQKRAAQIPQAVWDRHKDEICKLHDEMKVDDLVIEMQRRHNFTASKHQFVLQLKKWNRRKYKSASRGTRDVTTEFESSTPANSDSRFGDTCDLDLPVLPLSSIDEDFEISEEIPFQSSDHGDTFGNELENLPDSFCESFDLQGPTPATPVPTDTDLNESFYANNAENNDTELSILVHEGSSPCSRDLRRVPRAKRRRSTSSNETTSSARKRHKNEASPVGSANDSNVWDILLSTQDAPQTSTLSADDQSLKDDISSPGLDRSDQNTSSESVYENSSTPAAVSSLHSIPEDLEAKTKDIGQSSSLQRLFEFAEQGGYGAGLSYNHLREIEHLAGFFFGAALYKQAFMLYMIVYRTLKIVAHASKDVLLPILINLARSSSTPAHDEIVRSLLLQALRKRHRQTTGEPHENFLVNAFLTIIFRRQKELSKADHHCHRAIRCFDRTSAAGRSKITNAWRSLAVVACTKLDYSITEKRLLPTGSKISTDARRKICSRASDQLIVSLQSYWSSESITMEACMVVGPDVLFNSYDRPFIAQPRALRSLFEWCLQALENTSAQFDSRQPWRTFRAKGMKLRAIGITTLYCQLWRHWRLECAEMPLVNTTSDYWSVGIQEQLGIPADECLAAIPETIAVAWPFDDESMPMLANWRTYRAELCRRAIRGLKALLERPDVGLAHFFLQAYSARCIAESRHNDYVHPDPCEKLHLECVMAFATEHIDLDLPELDIHALDSPVEILSTSRFQGEASSDGPTELGETTQYVLPLPLTEGHATTAHATTAQAPVMATDELESSAQMNHGHELTSTSTLTQISMPSAPETTSLTHRGDSKSSHKSFNTVSSSIRSMLALRRRANHAQVKISEQVVLEPPSSAIRNGADIDMNLDSIMGLARASMESLSVHGSMSDGETADAAGSMTRLLNSSSSQIDVIVI